MLSKNLENSTSYDILYKFWKKARVYFTLSISRGGGGQAPGPPGFATGHMKQNNIFKPTLKFSEKTRVSNVNVSSDNFRLSEAGTPYTW